MNIMTNKPQSFHVRPASSDGDDEQFILAAWDSTLPFLASIGAGEMWGDRPFSQREGQRQEVVDVINGATKQHDGGRQFWIAETHCAEGVVKGGAAMTRESLPGYLIEHADLKKHMGSNKRLLYLEVLIADHRSNKRYKGAGKALVEFLERRARSDGMDALYVDIWAGNNRRLNGWV